MTIAGYTSYLEGVESVVKEVPSKVVAKSSRITYPGVSSVKPLEALQRSLAGLVDTQVQYPALDAAIAALEAAEWFQGIDYLQTAEYVKQGAFAITATLSDKGVLAVKDTLALALREGWGAKEYVDKVTEALVGEAAPLSEAHVETIFRTNVLSLHSDGQFKAVQTPLVKSYFPYARYWATKDKRVRPEHAELEKLGLDGTNFYNIDDPVFLKYRPIWAYNCRCNWHGATVEQAALGGVKEAQGWWNKALELSQQNRNTPYENLETARPSSMMYVTDPNFHVDEAFVRTN